MPEDETQNILADHIKKVEKIRDEIRQAGNDLQTQLAEQTKKFMEDLKKMNDEEKKTQKDE